MHVFIFGYVQLTKYFKNFSFIIIQCDVVHVVFLALGVWLIKISHVNNVKAKK